MAKAKKSAAEAVIEIQPNLRIFVACDVVSVEPDSKKISLHGLFDVIWLDEAPSAFKPFFLFARIIGGKGKKKFAFRVIGPDGGDIATSPIFNAVAKPGSTLDIVGQFGQLVLHKPGTITIVLESGGRPVGWPCEIRVRLREKGK